MSSFVSASRIEALRFSDALRLKGFFFHSPLSTDNSGHQLLWDVSLPNKEVIELEGSGCLRQDFLRLNDEQPFSFWAELN